MMPSRGKSHKFDKAESDKHSFLFLTRRGPSFGQFYKPISEGRQLLPEFSCLVWWRRLSKKDIYGFKDQAMKSLLATIFTAILLSMSLPFISASEAATESPGFQKCMDDVDLSAFKNSQWAACYEAELQIQDRRLNAVYQRVQRANTPELKQALLKGQRAWLMFRDAWCSYEEQAPYAPGGEVNKLACLLSITINQIERLEASAG